MNEEIIKKEIQKTEDLLKKIDIEGLSFYDNHKDLIINFIKRTLQDDLKFFKDRLKEGDNVLLSNVTPKTREYN